MQQADNQPGRSRVISPSRLVVAAAGLIGAAGVMAAAASSHGGDSRNLSGIATMCLAHGPALLALGLMAEGRFFRLSAALLATGTLLFTADLGAREWLGAGLFPGAAPLAGAGMIGGWLAVVAGAVISRQQHSSN